MPRWLQLLFATVLTFSLLFSVAGFIFGVVAYIESRKPDMPAPVITVVETTDPDLLTAKAIIGTQQVNMQNVVKLYEEQAHLVQLLLDRTVEEMRKAAQLKEAR